MQPQTNDEFRKRMAELEGMIDRAGQPAKPEEASDRPLMCSQARNFATLLGEYLWQIHLEDLTSHNASHAGLQQIDKRVTRLQGAVFVAALFAALFSILLSAAVVLLARSGG